MNVGTLCRKGLCCPKCRAGNNRVVDVRFRRGLFDDPGYVHRRRECLSCGFRWNTREVSEVV